MHPQVITAAARTAIICFRAKETLILISYSSSSISPISNRHESRSGWTSASSSSCATDDDTHRSKNNRQVKYQRHILSIEKVVFQFIECVLDTGTIRVLNLRPSGKSRSN